MRQTENEQQLDSNPPGISAASPTRIEPVEFAALIEADVPAALTGDVTTAVEQAQDPQDADDPGYGDDAKGERR